MKMTACHTYALMLVQLISIAADGTIFYVPMVMLTLWQIW